ncbi:unnamed protein product [Linum tenue]|uniref:Nuclear cap-binding protein subunit 2 n=1 Tax=Linum tenue TaxID=586396 RepID=A0AAV0HM22_9ROSI|nr:unnamed protein product [Linum tenue]
MASLFKDPAKLSAYRDRRFPGTQEEFEHALQTSVTVYIGNMSFYTTEEQVYELFTRAGEIKKIIMGLDKNSKTPCGFCFVLYYSREDTEDAVKYISGTILDDRPIRVDFDWGFQEGRQWGRGRSGGQAWTVLSVSIDMFQQFFPQNLLLWADSLIPQKFIRLFFFCHFPGFSDFLNKVIRRGGYGKLVQKELEAQRQLVDYGTGSLGSFPPIMPPQFGRQGGPGHGGSHRQGRDFHRKRFRDDDRHARGEPPKRAYEQEPRRNSDPESRPEKNPRFRESGDSDEEDDEKKGKA